jgi:hypothetical protein
VFTCTSLHQRLLAESGGALVPILVPRKPNLKLMNLAVMLIPPCGRSICFSSSLLDLLCFLYFLYFL